MTVQHHCSLQLVLHLDSPLFIAAHNGYLDVVRHLVEVGADKDKAMDTGATPLFIAAGVAP